MADKSPRLKINRAHDRPEQLSALAPRAPSLRLMKVISSPETILIPADARPWPAEDLPFPPQLLNVLRRIGVARLGQIHATPYADLREVRGCGTAAMGTNRERWATPDELARALRDRAGD